MRVAAAITLMLAVVVAADTRALEAQGRGEAGRDRAAEARADSAKKEQGQQRGQGAQRESPPPAQQERGQAAQPERRGPPPRAGQPAAPPEARGPAARRDGGPDERADKAPAARERGGMAGWIDRLRDRGPEPAPPARKLPEIKRETQHRALAAAGVNLDVRRADVRRDDGRGTAREDRRSDGLVILTGRQEVARRGGAPAFCRSGEGHPVWGRQWCLDMDFGLGREHGAWGTARMDDVVFRTRRPTAEELTRAVLIDVLGDVVLGRLDARRTALGATAPLTGRWIAREPDGTVLFVRSGPVPIAELVDRTGDGRVDLVVLNIER